MFEQDVYRWFVDNLDFWKNFLLVIIPVIITVYSSKFIVYSWQIQKEKSELRKSILSEFDESYPKLGQWMFETFFKIRYSYIDHSKIEYDKSKTMEEVIIFPDSIIEQPLKKFGHVLDEIHKEVNRFNFSTTKLFSSLILYFDNEPEIRKECVICGDYGNQLYKLLHQIIYSKNKEDFFKFCSEYGRINKLQIQKMNFIRIMLVYEKIKNPEKGITPKFLKGLNHNSITLNSRVEKSSTSQDNILLNSES